MNKFPYFLILLSLTMIFVLKAGFAKEKVIYKFKKYERFDLGNLAIKGNVIAPGDLSLRERKRRIFGVKLLDRTSFDNEIVEEIDSLR